MAIEQVIIEAQAALVGTVFLAVSIASVVLLAFWAGLGISVWFDNRK